jgi:hypothetical protein
LPGKKHTYASKACAAKITATIRPCFAHRKYATIITTAHHARSDTRVGTRPHCSLDKSKVKKNISP